MTAPTDQYSEAYALAEIAAFIRLLGQRDFWRSETKQASALAALSHVAWNTIPSQRVNSAFQVAMTDYSHRAAYIGVLP